MSSLYCIVFHIAHFYDGKQTPYQVNMYSKFYLLIIFTLLIAPLHSSNYISPLTENECKTYFASNDLNQKLQAIFSLTIHSLPIMETLSEREYLKSDDINQRIRAFFECPKKWRPSTRTMKSSIAKRSVLEEEYADEELDDFYVFWTQNASFGSGTVTEQECIAYVNSKDIQTMGLAFILCHGIAKKALKAMLTPPKSILN
ncbi:hypothetical protein I4U23_008166 [Adineta vaga]|nr:hypothetical protein I4U23_008166 [Adineta vaga]